MEHIGVDVHKMQSQICILNDDGEVIEQRIRTDHRIARASDAAIGVESRTDRTTDGTTENGRCSKVSRAFERRGTCHVSDPSSR